MELPAFSVRQRTYGTSSGRLPARAMVNPWPRPCSVSGGVRKTDSSCPSRWVKGAQGARTCDSPRTRTGGGERLSSLSFVDGQWCAAWPPTKALLLTKAHLKRSQGESANGDGHYFFKRRSLTRIALKGAKWSQRCAMPGNRAWEPPCSGHRIEIRVGESARTIQARVSTQARSPAVFQRLQGYPPARKFLPDSGT